MPHLIMKGVLWQIALSLALTRAHDATVSVGRDEKVACLEARLGVAERDLQAATDRIKATESELKATTDLVKGLIAQMPAPHSSTVTNHRNLDPTSFTHIDSKSVESCDVIVNCDLTLAGSFYYQGQLVRAPSPPTTAPSPSPSTSRAPSVPSPEPTYTPAPTAVDVDTICGSVGGTYHTSGGYEFCSLAGGRTHSASVQACSILGLQLVSITSAAKESAIETFLPSGGSWLYLTCPFSSSFCDSSVAGWQWANSGVQMIAGYTGMTVSGSLIVGSGGGEYCAHWWLSSTKWAPNVCSLTDQSKTLCEAPSQAIPGLVISSSERDECHAAGGSYWISGTYEFCYLPGGKTHSASIQACSGIGLQLVSITTEAKENAIESFLPSGGSWLYLTCPSQSGSCDSSLSGWKWAGSEVLMTSGYIGMTVSGSLIVGSGGGEYCAHWWLSSTKWAPNVCSLTDQSGSLCELPAQAFS